MEEGLQLHILELWERLRRILLVVLAATVIVGFTPVDTDAYTPMVAVLPNYIIHIAIPQNVTWRGHTYSIGILQYNPFAGFTLLVKTALLIGLLASSPYIVFELYQYVKPALYPREEKMLKTLGGAAVILFVIGVILGLYVISPIAFRWMVITSIAVFGNQLIAFSDVEQLFNTIILLALAVGVAFETPLVTYLLVKTGIVSYDSIKSNWRYVLIGSMVLGAIVSPDPTGMGMLLVASITFTSIMVSGKIAGRHPISSP